MYHDFDCFTFILRSTIRVSWKINFFPRKIHSKCFLIKALLGKKAAAAMGDEVAGLLSFSKTTSYRLSTSASWILQMILHIPISRRSSCFGERCMGSRLISLLLLRRKYCNVTENFQDLIKRSRKKEMKNEVKNKHGWVGLYLKSIPRMRLVI